jgi:hypothetical protein
MQPVLVTPATSNKRRKAMTDREQLSRLVKKAKAFRETPIVDDDFLDMKYAFDLELMMAEQRLSVPMPTVVTLCGSTRFWRTFQDQSLRLTMEGKIVLSIGAARCADDDDKTFGGFVPESEFNAAKQRLDELHCRKIDMSDEILVLNVGGYIGESTRREIEHAKRCGVPIRYLEPID